MTEFEQATSSLKRTLGLIFALSGLTTLLQLALPFYMTQVFTHVLPSRSVETLIALSVLALIAFALYAVFDMVKQAVLVRCAARYEALLAGPIVYSHFLDGSRDAASGADLMQDIRLVRGFIGSRALAGAAEAPFIPLFMGILFMVDFALGMMITVGMILMVVLAVLQQNAIKSGVLSQNKSMSAANRLLQTHIEQSEIVRVMGLHKIAVNRWGARNADTLTTFVDVQTVGGFYGAISRFLRFALQAGILGVGAFLVIQGDVASTIVFACMMIGGRALAPLDGLVGSWSSLTGAMEAHKRIRDSLVSFYVEPDKTVLPDPVGNYVVDKLVYGLPGQGEAVIKRISFAFQAGESIGIIGPSGAGKSTLLRLLSGAIAPSSGAVRLDGADLKQWNRIQLGQHIGYVPQSIEFLPGTVSENIARFDPEANDDAVVEAARSAGVHDLILKFPQGYNTVLGRGAFAPSGGQKQLLAVARAFYREPKILFFDEPNSNLDQQGDHILMQAIGRATERGATIVIVTQRPVLLQAVGKVLVMKDGLIDSFGPRTAVMPKVVKPVAVPAQPATIEGAARAPAQIEVATAEGAAK